MDNVVQNINIEDIVPSNFQPTHEEKQKIEELSQLIKKFGLIDPILVRPKNGKYEIILGIENYQAALMANQNKIPAIIKEVDDEIFSKYSNIDNNQAVSLNSLSTETFSEKEKKSDIVNLSELSKIKLEYERDDLKMNNGQMNNNMINNDLNQSATLQSNQIPTFGGRFFPSLEDEPTNMNMMGGMNMQPVAPEAPTINNNTGVNNNLIDLTDLSTEKEQITVSTPTNDFNTNPINIPTPDSTINTNSVPPQPINTSLSPSEPQILSDPTSGTIINIDSLQNNNPAVSQISESTPEPVSMEILNADFGAQSQPQKPYQFDYGTNINSNIPQNQGFDESSRSNQNNAEMNQSPLGSQPTPSFDTIPNLNVNPSYGVAPENKSTPVSSKDITPVTSTIKDLVTDLEKFGYKINITEEDLPTTAKITIEVEK